MFSSCSTCAVVSLARPRVSRAISVNLRRPLTSAQTSTAGKTAAAAVTTTTRSSVDNHPMTVRSIFSVDRADYALRSNRAAAVPPPFKYWRVVASMLIIRNPCQISVPVFASPCRCRLSQLGAAAAAAVAPASVDAEETRFRAFTRRILKSTDRNDGPYTNSATRRDELVRLDRNECGGHSTTRRAPT